MKNFLNAGIKNTNEIMCFFLQFSERTGKSAEDYYDYQVRFITNTRTLTVTKFKGDNLIFNLINLSKKQPLTTW